MFRDLRRVLSPGGWVVFSVQHPHADFEDYDDTQNYHEIERVSANPTRCRHSRHQNSKSSGWLHESEALVNVAGLGRRNRCQDRR
ncbi:hypothetical protein [Halocatena marina]|uniref:hypothetical protein n=1 Tax=Halocatena marina TaxID=2934937 RepID=UPI0022244A9C|nr:hypothetical protein [Halocatena marina]